MKNNIFYIIAFTILFLGCNKNPEPINYNKDECAHCMMTIADPKFGCELVTETGKIYKFDSIECMVDYILIERGFKISSLWITDYSNPKNLVDATKAYFIVSKNIVSPMGKDLAGFMNENDRDKFFEEVGGNKLNWKEVIEYIKNSK